MLLAIKLMKACWKVSFVPDRNSLPQVRTDRGTKSLSEVLPLLRREGYDGVECSVKQAYAMNEAGEFVTLMKVTCPS
jgi:hypothetical protein